jgi:hypothetical protein
MSLRYCLPRGPLTKLFLTHIMEGHALIAGGQQNPRLFTTRRGNELSPSTLTQYWASLFKENPRTVAAGLEYFSPNLGRTIFVESYVHVHGELPDMLDGAAAVMGTSARQFRASYNPSRNQRVAQSAIDAHAAYRPPAGNHDAG